jgi:hypothetical protein
MLVKLFLRENDGDYNYEKTYYGVDDAETALKDIQAAGGYWWIDKNDRGKDSNKSVFIPWHRVDYASIEKEE